MVRPLLFHLLACLGASAATPGFQVLDSSFLSIKINAVNADGSVFVGTGETSPGQYEAFVWRQEDGFTPLGTLPGGFNSYGKGVSANGQHVVGHVLSLTDGYPTPFIWNADQGMVSLPRMPGCHQATACDVSNDGNVVVGGADTEDSFSLNNQPARWVDGIPASLGILTGGSASGEALGVSEDGIWSAGYSSAEGGDWGAFRHRTDQGMSNLGWLPGVTGSGYSEGTAISTTGKYVVGGTKSLINSYPVMFLWSEARGMKDLGRLSSGDFSVRAQSVNRKGTIVVGGTSSKAIIWTAKHGTKELKLFLEQDCGINLGGWSLSYAFISDDGTTFVGRASKSGVSPSPAFIAVIPPSFANDSDADGMDDEWEQDHFGGIAPVPTEDFDNDGTDNRSEFRLGLVPNSGQSYFAAKARPDGTIEWPGAANTTFKIERSPNLATWTVVEPNLQGTEGTTTYADPSPLPEAAFYRVTLND